MGTVVVLNNGCNHAMPTGAARKQRILSAHHFSSKAM
jgi:hypothetical protein